MEAEIKPRPQTVSELSMCNQNLMYSRTQTRLTVIITGSNCHVVEIFGEAAH